MYIKDKDGNYVPTPSSKGADGREVSLRVANNYIQWRYPDTEWTNLVPLSDLKGEPGTDGIDGREVHMRVVSDTLQWRLGDSGTWQTLMSLSTVTDGAAFGGMVVDKTLVLAEMEAGSGGGTADAVTYTPQTLTEEQKSQARTNIGAEKAGTAYTKPASGIPKSDLAADVQTSLAKADTAISYDSQTLTDAQKQQARQNIGAVDENLGCNKYNIHVTTTSGTTKDFTYYTNEGEIRQPTEAVDSSIRTAFLGLTLWPSAKGISENLAKTLSKQYKILYDANYIDSPCCIIKSPLESGDKVLLSYHSSDNTVHVSGSWTDGYYNIIYDVANDVLTYFYVDNNISAVNGAVNQLVMSANPTEDMHIATKQYVDTAKTEAQQLGLTTATPGQIIKVKTVQDGKPTEWEAANMPSGGVEWYEVIDMETAENVNDLIISTDKSGRPISGYHALAMTLCFMIPADSTQTSTNGSVWVYPIVSDYPPPYSVRIITNLASWKTTPRTYNYLYAGSNRAIFLSGANAATIFDTDYNNVFNGIKLHVNNAGDHLPAGTKVRCLVLSKGWTA